MKKLNYYKLHDLYLLYKKKKGEPIFISDWNTTENIKRPNCILHKALSLSEQDCDRYYFVEEDQGKEIFLSYCNSRNPNHAITERNFIITPNATMSISLSILALKKFDKTNFLALTPVYFTFDVIFEPLNCKYIKISNELLLDDTREFEQILVDMKVEVIILTDPLYGSGKSLSNKFYRTLFNIIEKHGIWIILDYARGGLLWNSNEYDLFDFNKHRLLASYKKHIFIDSISKKLFINGFKTSLLCSTPDIIAECEKLADGFIGSICASEIRLFETIYSLENHNYIVQNMITNLEKAKQSYKLVNSILLDSPVETSTPDDGTYCLCLIPKYLFQENDDDSIFQFLLTELGIYTLPQSLYDIESNQYYCFRINLLLERYQLVDAISRIANLSKNLR